MIIDYNKQWRPTKVETTGTTLNYETLILRLFETFLDFKTKKQVVPRHAGTSQKGALDNKEILILIT